MSREPSVLDDLIVVLAAMADGDMERRLPRDGSGDRLDVIACLVDNLGAELGGRLRAAEALEKRVAESLDDGQPLLILVGPDGVVRGVSPPEAEAPWTTLVGAPLLSRVAPGDRARAASLLARRADWPATARVDLELPDGASATMRIEAMPAPSGEPGELVLRLRSERSMEVLAAVLERSDRLAAIGQMAAGVAHELNNPLATLRLTHHEIRADLGRATPQVASAVTGRLEHCESTLGRMAGVVESLRTYGLPAEPASGAVAIDRLFAVVRETVRPTLRHLATLDLVAEPGLCAQGDFDQCVQVLVNLVLNAGQAYAHAAPTRNVVDVRVWLTPGGVKFRVRDRAGGVEPALRSDLFEPYRTSRRGRGGTGLGLPIARRLVEGMGGGLVLVDNDVGGSDFEFTLPQAESVEPVEPTPSQPLELLASPTRTRLLLVEDEAMIARSLTRLLKAHADVTWRATAEEALELLAERQDWDVVLFDLMLPGMSGAALYREASALGRATGARWVVMTGGAVTPETQKFLDEPNVPVLRKPFDLDVIRALF